MKLSAMAAKLAKLDGWETVSKLRGAFIERVPHDERNTIRYVLPVADGFALTTSTRNVPDAQSVAHVAKLFAFAKAKQGKLRESEVTRIAPYDCQAQRHLAQPKSSAPDLEPIRIAVNALARLRKNRIAFWEQWLRRVVESAAVMTPVVARDCAAAALQHTIPVPARFEYQCERPRCLAARNTNGPFELFVVTPRQGGRRLNHLGRLSGLDPMKRKIDATFTPAIPTDRYRMGYYLRSVCMSELLDDAKMGYYDTVTCTNAKTGEEWRFVAT